MITLEKSKQNDLENILNQYFEELRNEFDMYLQAIKNIQIDEIKGELNISEEEILEI